jgi:protein-S-isoprenylcysteine O-methyltransferase Ste14
MVLILIGITILLCSLTPFFVVVTFAIIMEKVFIQVEERMIEKTFGDEYLEYKAKIRKWL